MAGEWTMPIDDLATRDEVRILAVDTGLVGLGWAMWWGVAKHLIAKPKAPTACGVIEMPGPASWTDRAWMMMEKFETRAFWTAAPGAALAPDYQVIEWPEFRAGNARGHAAAAEDSLSKLAFMCGMHHQLAFHHGVPTFLAPVSKWKGQLPKDVVTQRVTRAIGKKDKCGNWIEDHAWDAVGIGLWFMGHRLDDPRKFGGGR